MQERPLALGRAEKTPGAARRGFALEAHHLRTAARAAHGHLEPVGLLPRTGL